MKLLQICNVGRIVGGTAACAWSITRALPEVEHHVAFLSSITDETKEVFAGTTLHQRQQVTNAFVHELRCDSVILHNISPARAEPITAAWTLQYVHSAGVRAPADATRYCSRWLAHQCLGERATQDDVLYQGVPCPSGPLRPDRSDRPLVVGRFCTPTSTKWPASLPAFYAPLAERHPDLDWEFVGCPAGLQAALTAACRGRVAFHPAGWRARRHLAAWDVLLYHHPTLTETFGRTVAEAMRAGCIPVVDGRGGFLEQFAPDSGRACRTANDFGFALETLQGTSLRRRMALRARERANERFSLTGLRQRLLSLWGRDG